MYITNIMLKDVRCIKDVNIDLTKGSGAKSWLVIVGNNGVGKTSFLRSLAMGLCDKTGATSLFQDTSGDWIRKGEKKATIEVQLVDKGTPYTITTEIENVSGKEIIKRTDSISKDIPWDDIFVCAYGANRSIEGDRVQERYAAADALYTFFNYDFKLLNPELMLRRRAKTEEDIKEICEWLADILLLERGSVGLDDFGIFVRKYGYGIHWGSMPDGYEATITMILDMLGWAMLAGKTKKKNTLQGIMIIDELEQHLHPELQRFIVKKLHDNFPNIQFIASTHSPICAAGLADLPDDKCGLELLAVGKNGFVSNEPQPVMRGWRYDLVLTSDAFGIPNRNVTTSVLMDKMRELYLKDSLSKGEEAELNRLLKKLKKESPIGAEEESTCITREEIRKIRKELEDKKSD
ncbi:MAG: AAA family ATPase [Deltaproteobacteria bacterium]|nr:AAA family ATPase [Deltaproteobacteria bacterium]